MSVHTATATQRRTSKKKLAEVQPQPPIDPYVQARTDYQNLPAHIKSDVDNWLSFGMSGHRIDRAVLESKGEAVEFYNALAKTRAALPEKITLYRAQPKNPPNKSRGLLSFTEDPKFAESIRRADPGNEIVTVEVPREAVHAVIDLPDTGYREFIVNANVLQYRKP